MLTFSCLVRNLGNGCYDSQIKLYMRTTGGLSQNTVLALLQCPDRTTLLFIYIVLKISSPIFSFSCQDLPIDFESRIPTRK